MLLVSLACHSDMARRPPAPLRPPADATLPLDGVYPIDRVSAEARLHNPLPPTPSVVAQGRELYRIYCAVCHGPAGAGDGPVGEYYRRGAPALTAPYIQSYADGYLWAIIREGGYAMPSFAEVMNETERWTLVHFIRRLPEP